MTQESCLPWQVARRFNRAIIHCRGTRDLNPPPGAKQKRPAMNTALRLSKASKELRDARKRAGLDAKAAEVARQAARAAKIKSKEARKAAKAAKKLARAAKDEFAKSSKILKRALARLEKLQRKGEKTSPVQHPVQATKKAQRLKPARKGSPKTPRPPANPTPATRPIRPAAVAAAKVPPAPPRPAPAARPLPATKMIIPAAARPKPTQPKAGEGTVVRETPAQKPGPVPPTVPESPLTGDGLGNS